jgi:hypothetical protein
MVMSGSRVSPPIALNSAPAAAFVRLTASSRSHLLDATAWRTPPKSATKPASASPLHAARVFLLTLTGDVAAAVASED